MLDHLTCPPQQRSPLLSTFVRLPRPLPIFRPSQCLVEMRTTRYEILVLTYYANRWPKASSGSIQWSSLRTKTQHGLKCKDDCQVQDLDSYSV